jgi:hypothetical protein
MNTKLLSDLEINNKIIPIIDNTITKYGTTIFKSLFNTIHYDKHILLHRRYEITNCLNKRRTVNKITKLLRKINKLQHSIDWLFNTEATNYKDLLFNNNNFNIKGLITIRNFIRIYNPSFIIVMYLIIYLIFRYYGININIKQYLLSIYQGYQLFVQGILIFIITDNKLRSFITNILVNMYTVYQLYTIYNSIDSSITHYWKLNDFHKSITDIYNFINCVSDIQSFNIIPYYTNLKLKYIRNIFNINKKGSANLLITRKDSTEYKYLFDNIFHYVGYIDSIISIANLVKYNGYTFPYLDFNSKKPYIKAYQLWNPYYDN